jgi:hypothetical protein
VSPYEVEIYYSLFVIVFGVSSIPAFAQRNVTPAIERDPVLEKDAKHNLDVAWQHLHR